jgi:peptide/nickel transport system ATP-binding protein
VFIPPGCRFHPRCPVAIERCPQEDPALAQPVSAEAGHRAACLLLPT